MTRSLAALVFSLLAATAVAEPPASPYVIRWSFPADEVSAIEVDRGDLSVSRFHTAFDLARYMHELKPTKKAASKPANSLIPGRELCVIQLDADGKVRNTDRYVATLEDWRMRLGDALLERLEDEFDAHLRMVLPRKRAPSP